MKQNEKNRKMAETSWIARVHGVSEARVHGVSRALVHGVCCERMNSSGSEGIFQDKDNFEDLEGGEARRWVDPLAKHQICGSNQPNLRRSTNCKKNFWGYFWWGFSD